MTTKNSPLKKPPDPCLHGHLEKYSIPLHLITNGRQGSQLTTSIQTVSRVTLLGGQWLKEVVVQVNYPTFARGEVSQVIASLECLMFYFLKPQLVQVQTVHQPCGQPHWPHQWYYLLFSSFSFFHYLSLCASTGHVKAELQVFFRD